MKIRGRVRYPQWQTVHLLKTQNRPRPQRYGPVLQNSPAPTSADRFRSYSPGACRHAPTLLRQHRYPAPCHWEPTVRAMPLCGRPRLLCHLYTTYAVPAVQAVRRVRAEGTSAPLPGAQAHVLIALVVLLAFVSHMFYTRYRSEEH